MRTPSLRWIRLSAVLLFLAAMSVELLQSIPEIVPFGHALGEIIRNLGYALAAAYLFHFVMIELPQSERERLALRLCEPKILTIIEAPSSLVRRVMKGGGVEGSGVARTRLELIKALKSLGGVVWLGGTPVSLANLIETLRQLIAGSMSEIGGQVPFLPPSLQQALMGVRHAASIAPESRVGSFNVDPGSPDDDEILKLVAMLSASRELALALVRESPDKSIRMRLKPFTRAPIPTAEA